MSVWVSFWKIYSDILHIYTIYIGQINDQIKTPIQFGHFYGELKVDFFTEFLLY